MCWQIAYSFNAIKLSPESTDKFQVFWLWSVALWGRCAFVSLQNAAGDDVVQIIFEGAQTFLRGLVILLFDNNMNVFDNNMNDEKDSTKP